MYIHKELNEALISYIVKLNIENMSKNEVALVRSNLFL